MEARVAVMWVLAACGAPAEVPDTQDVSCPQWFRDRDGDGYGDSGDSLDSCGQPDGYAARAGDCDDLRPTVHPGAAERCDGLDLDEDCNGLADDDDVSAIGGEQAWVDADGDGLAGPDPAGVRCDPTSGAVFERGDCDDSDAHAWTGAAERDDPAACMSDEDGDGYGAVDVSAPQVPGTDCDDSDPSTHPGVWEPAWPLADGVDNDCDGVDRGGVFEDFELGDPRDDVWQNVSGDAQVTDAFVYRGAFALRLGGAGGTVRTVDLDTTLCEGVQWGYRGKRGPELPDGADLLSLHWWSGSGWVAEDIWAGGALDTDFGLRAGVVEDPAALHQAFSLRLRSAGSAGFDDFYVDDLFVGCASEDADGDGLPGTIDCDDADPLHQTDCGLCLDFDGDGYGWDCDAGPDCADTDPAVHPGAVDATGDGVDGDCDGMDGALLADDFATGALDPSVWLEQVGDAEYVTEPVHSAPFALGLGGGGAVATTVAVDASGCSSVRWRFLGRRGPESPDEGDSLAVSWSAGGAWSVVDTWVGEGFTDTAFAVRAGLLPGGAVSDQLQLRLESSGSGATADDFYVDDLSLGCAL